MQIVFQHVLYRDKFRSFPGLIGWIDPLIKLLNVVFEPVLTMNSAGFESGTLRPSKIAGANRLSRRPDGHDAIRITVDFTWGSMWGRLR
jgi:hypothetical protein